MDIERILNFWFGLDLPDSLAPRLNNELWFGFNEQTDQQIKKYFEQDMLRASTGLHNNWKDGSRSRLALIILLDQFPRNIYRGTAQAFAFDSLALHLCLEGIEVGHDIALTPIYQAFYYMPLEHSESPKYQALCVEKLQIMLKQAPTKAAAKLQSFLHYAEVHMRIIERFGRFPHRNALLGRKSTAAEQNYLNQPHTDFGQN